MAVIKRKKRFKIIFAVLCALIIATVAVWELNERANEKVVFTNYSFSHEDIPDEFDGYKIMVISDLHNAPFSKQIINYVNSEETDAIFFVGDIVQLPDCNASEAAAIAKEFKKKIPMYAVSGNHESQNEEYKYIKDCLRWEGVKWLEDSSTFIEKGGSKIMLVGAADINSNTIDEQQQTEIAEYIGGEISNAESGVFSVVLNHRANLYPALKNSGASLIVSGHLHGGIVRLPFIGGIVGEHGVLKPQKYEYGFIKEEDASPMIVSGGCDKNPEKKRWFNPPEVVIITLESE